MLSLRCTLKLLRVLLILSQTCGLSWGGLASCHRKCSHGSTMMANEGRYNGMDGYANRIEFFMRATQ